MPQRPQQPGDVVTMRSSFNLLYVLALIHMRMVTPFLRTKTGSRARGLLSVIAGVFMFYLAHGLYDQMLLNYFWAWLIAVLVQGWTSNKRAHSRYDGVPKVAFLLCPFNKDEGVAKFVIEPVICLGAGYFLLQYSDALGKLVMSSAFSMMFVFRLYQHTQDKRERDIIDARLEAESLTNGVRQRY